MNNTNKPMLNAYLIFSGECEEAMTFYQSVLGGELKMSRYSEMPGMPVAEADKNKIIHALLENDTLTFMASDDNEKSPVQKGNNFHMSISGTDNETLTGYFNKLSEGGHVDMPLEKAPWGDTFGMLTDKYGIHWMINITQAK